MIDLVTFTGVDDQTDMDELAQVAGTYPFAEFGILMGSATDESTGGIFPPYTTIVEFITMSQQRGGPRVGQRTQSSGIQREQNPPKR